MARSKNAAILRYAQDDDRSLSSTRFNEYNAASAGHLGAMVRDRRATMPKTLRTIAGVILIGSLLAAAWLATRTCTADLFVYDSCLWIWARTELGLPASKFLRAAFLELVGLAILAGIYLTFRYVFPSRVNQSPPPAPQE